MTSQAIRMLQNSEYLVNEESYWEFIFTQCLRSRLHGGYLVKMLLQNNSEEL